MIVTAEQYAMWVFAIVFITGAIFGILTKAIARAWFELGKGFIKA